MVYLIIYLVGVLYLIKPIDGYSFRENATYTILWPVVFVTLLLAVLLFTAAGKYADVKKHFSK